jgi:hypothetical protein
MDCGCDEVANDDCEAIIDSGCDGYSETVMPFLPCIAFSTKSWIGSLQLGGTVHLDGNHI